MRTTLFVCLWCSACSTLEVTSAEPDALGGAEQAIAVDPTRYAIGRLTSAGNGRYRTLNQYDALGRTVAMRHSIEGSTFDYATTYGFPVGGAAAAQGTVPIAEQLPGNETITHQYDLAGGRQAVRSNGQNIVGDGIATAPVTRNVRGQPTQVIHGDTTITRSVYADTGDLRLRATSIKKGSVALHGYAYGYDALGNVTQVLDACTGTGGAVTCTCDPVISSCAAGPYSSSFLYDSMDQLIASSLDPGGYAYDELGNLVTKEGVSRTFGGSGRGPHQLARVGTTDFTYDANGNLRTAGALVATWNAQNMPVRIVTGATTVSSSFRGEHRWKKVETTAAGTRTVLYPPSVRVEDGALRKMIASGLAERAPDNSLTFFHGDHLGSSVLTTNATGAVTHRVAYTPFGSERPSSLAGVTPAWQYNFKERDADGLYDYGARTYDPLTGVWLSADTDLTDGLNRYAYVGNNPLSFVDPDGHQSSMMYDPRGPQHLTEAITGEISGVGAGAAHEAVSMIEPYDWLAPVHRFIDRKIPHRADGPGEWTGRGLVVIASLFIPGGGPKVAAAKGPRLAVAAARTGAGSRMLSRVRKIARETERVYQNSKAGTCTAAAMHNLDVLKQAGIKDVNIVLIELQKIAVGGFTHHAVTGAKIEGRQVYLSGGRVYTDLDQMAGSMNNGVRSVTQFSPSEFVREMVKTGQTYLAPLTRVGP